MEVERDISSLDSNLSTHSYLGRPLDSSVTSEEELLSRQSQSMDDAFRLRRDSRISVSGSFETPELDVPVSQFEIPRVERAKQREEEQLTERRAVSKITEMLLEEVRAKIDENEQRGYTASTAQHSTAQHSPTQHSPSLQPRNHSTLLRTPYGCCHCAVSHFVHWPSAVRVLPCRVVS